MDGIEVEFSDCLGAIDPSHPSTVDFIDGSLKIIGIAAGADTVIGSVLTYTFTNDNHDGRFILKEVVATSTDKVVSLSEVKVTIHALVTQVTGCGVGQDFQYLQTGFIAGIDGWAHDAGDDNEDGVVDWDVTTSYSGFTVRYALAINTDDCLSLIHI